MSSSSTQDGEPTLKRLKTSSEENLKKSNPATIVTWNANGLVSRCQYNQSELQQMLRETGFPDVLCLQEVRLKAMASANRGMPLASEYKSVKEAMESTVFRDYHKFWSLADSRYAGTLTLLHKRLALPTDDFVAYTTRSALSLLLKKYNLASTDIGLSCNGNSRDETSRKEPPAKKQTSISAFFTRKAAPEKKVSKVLPPDHHPEGRFQFLCFPDCDLMQTYVPNNGTKEESFQRRRDWDRDVKEFLEHRGRILAKVQQQHRPLLWCGDMNVAKDHRDGTHWEERSVKNSDGETTVTIYEWWKDEKVCFVADKSGKLDPNRSSGDRGIPSFTTNERRRFADILETANLSDVWRELHPNENEGTGDSRSSNKYQTKWDRPCWTWRGHLGRSGNRFGSKYQGKGQRLDYFLLSPADLTTKVVQKCEILGYGEMRFGFFGSDHCPSILELKHPLGIVEQS